MDTATTTDQGPATSPAEEVGLTLDAAVPRTMGFWDTAALWGNLGVSLLGFTGAIFVLAPLDTGTPMSLAAAGLALVAGSVLGTLAVALAGIPGTRTGAPSMVLLRGLFGAKASYLPTTLNILQLLGWTTFELVTIGTALHQITPGVPRWIYVLAGGVLTTALALRPLGWIRVLRKYVAVAVIVSLLYLGAQLLRHPLTDTGAGNWHGFWISVDTVIGVSVSWVPLISDYSRHARSARGAFAGAFLGYTIAQICCYGLGLLALVTVTQGDANKIFGSFLAIPLGTLAFGILAVRELDQSFADTYSTAVSVQNFRPHWDRRTLAVAVGTLATAAALVLDINDYENFLILIGSVFMPLLGVLLVDYFLISRARWHLGTDAATRWMTLIPWALGFGAYQMINPGQLGWWSHAWAKADSWLQFTPRAWMSASIASFLVAALATAPARVVRTRQQQESSTIPGEAAGSEAGK